MYKFCSYLPKNWGNFKNLFFFHLNIFRFFLSFWSMGNGFNNKSWEEGEETNRNFVMDIYNSFLILQLDNFF